MGNPNEAPPRLWHLQVSNAPISYVVTVQTNPSICEAVTRMLGVRHETPQAILVHAGRAVWRRAHYEMLGIPLDSGDPYYLVAAHGPAPNVLDLAHSRGGRDLHRLLRQAEKELPAMARTTTVEPELNSSRS